MLSTKSCRVNFSILLLSSAIIYLSMSISTSIYNEQIIIMFAVKKLFSLLNLAKKQCEGFIIGRTFFYKSIKQKIRCY